jgi:hypothetical protein
VEYCEGELELFFRDHILYTIVPIVCTRNRLLAVDTFDEGAEGLFSQLILTTYHEIMRINPYPVQASALVKGSRRVKPDAAGHTAILSWSGRRIKKLSIYLRTPLVALQAECVASYAT